MSASLRQLQEMNSMLTKVVSVAAGAALILAIAATPVRAHHSFAAEFDAKRPVKLRGTVVKMEWINPHSWIHMDVKDPVTGKVERWMVEGGAPTRCCAAAGRRSRCRRARKSWSRASRPRTARIAPTDATSRFRMARSCSSDRQAQEHPTRDLKSRPGGR